MLALLALSWSVVSYIMLRQLSPRHWEPPMLLTPENALVMLHELHSRLDAVIAHPA